MKIACDNCQEEIQLDELFQVDNMNLCIYCYSLYKFTMKGGENDENLQE